MTATPKESSEPAMKMLAKLKNIFLDVRKWNSRLYRWSIEFFDKYQHNYFYRKIVRFLQRNKIQKLLRIISLCGYRLDVSVSFIETSRRPGRTILEIRKVSREQKNNIYLFIPHMGSSLIEENLIFHYDFKRMYVDLKAHRKGYFKPELLRIVANSQNYIVVAHIWPDRYNLLMLEDYKIRRFAVQVTDPRLQLVREIESAYNRAKARNDMRQAIRAARFLSYIPDNYIELNPAERISITCELGGFEPIVYYAEEWMKIKKNPFKEWNFEIYITRWDDLVLNTRKYYDDLTSFFELPKINWTNPLFTERYCMNKSTSLDWKNGLPQSLIDMINSFVSDELLEFYGWER